MTTEAGVPRIAEMRHYIETLRQRVDFITERIVMREREGRSASSHFDITELKALVWAIPVLEAEWDNAARIRRNMDLLQHRLSREERGDIKRRRPKQIDWQEATPA